MSHSLGGWKSEINVLADSVPSGDPLPGLQRDTRVLARWRGSTRAPRSLSYKDPNPVFSGLPADDLV